MRHFCASIFVIDKYTKSILLVKHKKFNKWVQPGGHIEDNETPEEAALREVYEETGLRVNLLGQRVPRESDFVRPFAIQKNWGKQGDLHIDIVYVAEPMSRFSVPKYDPNESLDVGWFTRNDLENISVFPDIKITMDYLLKEYMNE
ncbi:MAG: NUDIX domain-containing protein [Bacilli bacterium]|nr:NUDIX domain-containing protein [Bacilli bacterium]